MQKPKIAISLDKSLLDLIDSKVDGSVIRSRSQAIELYLKKGLQEQLITIAVLMIKGEHIPYMLKQIKGKSLVKNQLEFFKQYGIKKVYILTHPNKSKSDLAREVMDSEIEVKIIEKDVQGTARALMSIKDELKRNFIVMSGDTFINFDLTNMMQKHLNLDKLATMGVITKEKPLGYGIAIMDGDLIVDFQEKPKHYTTTIINAGIYIFKPEVFELFGNVTSIERELFTKLAKINQLVGFFIHGEYVHVG